MSKNVAFHGGHSIYTLGPVNDVAAFFSCINRLMPEAQNSVSFELITDRLYRRYLRQSELDQASRLMDEIKSAFQSIPNNSIDWHDLGVTREVSKLDTAKKTVEEVFEQYFELFLKAKGSAISFFQAYGIYNPVRLVFADLPEFALDRERSLSEYDEKNVAPFWLR